MEAALRAKANRNSQPVSACNVCWQEASHASEEATCSCSWGRQTSSFRSSFNAFSISSGWGEGKNDHCEPAGWHGLQHHDLCSYFCCDQRDKAWEETAVSNPKSWKIPCPTQRRSGGSKAKTFERWTCRAGETLGQGSSPKGSVTLGLSFPVPLVSKPAFFLNLWNLSAVGHGFLLRRFLLGSLWSINVCSEEAIPTPKKEYC